MFERRDILKGDHKYLKIAAKMLNLRYSLQLHIRLIIWMNRCRQYSHNLPGHKLTYPIIEYDDIYLKVYSYPIHILMAEKMNFSDGIEKELEIQIINNLI